MSETLDDAVKEVLHTCQEVKDASERILRKSQEIEEAIAKVTADMQNARVTLSAEGTIVPRDEIGERKRLEVAMFGETAFHHRPTRRQKTKW